MVIEESVKNNKGRVLQILASLRKIKKNFTLEEITEYAYGISVCGFQAIDGVTCANCPFDSDNVDEFYACCFGKGKNKSWPTTVIEAWESLSIESNLRAIRKELT